MIGNVYERDKVKGRWKVENMTLYWKCSNCVNYVQYISENLNMYMNITIKLYTNFVTTSKLNILLCQCIYILMILYKVCKWQF